MNKIENMTNEESLLSSFNNRESSALRDVYSLYHSEFMYFATQIFREYNAEACDVVHDVILKIWLKKNIKFKNLKTLKAYIYASIRNYFYDYVIHNKCIRKFNDKYKENPSNFIYEMAESETLYIIYKAVELLPPEISKIFKMILDGWRVEDISNNIGRSHSYIYSKKEEAIGILKKKFKNNNMFMMLIISNL